jgi:hypothetical protein
LKEAAAIDPIMFVVVRNVIGHNLVSRLAGKISFHLFLPIRLDFIPGIPASGRELARPVFARTPRSGGGP